MSNMITCRCLIKLYLNVNQKQLTIIRFGKYKEKILLTNKSFCFPPVNTAPCSYVTNTQMKTVKNQTTPKTNTHRDLLTKHLFYTNNIFCKNITILLVVKMNPRALTWWCQGWVHGKYK